nr:tRNA (adenosine(37)-N6)-threonylcarbamoyltransferase complex dimerization subunit type 1 TsaB [Rhodovulum sp. ES.010]
MPAEGGHGPTILAFDTSLPQISAAVLSGGIVVEREEAMHRGQAERLIPLLADLMTATGVTWRDMDLIAVGIGPGNFTGTRISVAAARGLALGLGIPAIGVSLFEVLRDPQTPSTEPAALLSLEAPRGMAIVQAFSNGKPNAPPQVIDPAARPLDLDLPHGAAVRGFRADEIARPFGSSFEAVGPAQVAARMARLAALRAGEADFDPAARPAPLYVRPADAKPPADAPPVILDDA